MVRARCVQKFRDKYNRIKSYRLELENGRIVDLSAEIVKQEIHSGSLQVVNLRLTPKYRLIDIPQGQAGQTLNIDKKAQKKLDADKELMMKYIQKAKLIGKLVEMPTYCGHTCYAISTTPEKCVIYIPDDVIQLNGTNISSSALTPILNKIHGDIKIVGGVNLINARLMFFHGEMKHLDLSSFDTRNITNMSYLFLDTKIQSINFLNFDTSNVTNMEGMFGNCKIEALDLSCFDTRKVITMNSMFNSCTAKSINLSSFDTSNVTDMNCMFSSCQAQPLNISHFNTSNVLKMSGMFQNYKAPLLDISNFDASKVYNFDYIFNLCTSKVKMKDPKLIEAFEIEKQLRSKKSTI